MLLLSHMPEVHSDAAVHTAPSGRLVDGVGIGELEAPGVATGDMVLPGDTMLGSDCTAMPSAAEAATAVPRLKESEVCTAAGVVEAGTAIVAVMITLAAATLTDTKAASTPALAAIEFRRLEVSE